MSFEEASVVTEAYRPFTSLYLYLNRDLADFPSKQLKAFPTVSGTGNRQICVSGVGHNRFQCLCSSLPVALDILEKTQCFPFYIWSEDGTNRRENITDWALTEFRSHYADKKITKWDIFHATYAVLHHPEYRARYAANLKRELPRIPFPPDFHAFAAAGKRLMELHIGYEKQKEYKLEQIEDPKAEVSFRVEKMKLSKDKTELRYNDFLLLRGIPAKAYEYRLGNRSALEWVIDQYRVSTDSRSGIVNDPNREDDPHYILRLIGQVITVSLETQEIIEGLPSLNLPS
jgi:predicted helicase